MTDQQRDRLLLAIARGLMLSLGSGRFSEDAGVGRRILEDALREAGWTRADELEADLAAGRTG